MFTMTSGPSVVITHLTPNTNVPIKCINKLRYLETVGPVRTIQYLLL